MIYPLQWLTHCNTLPITMTYPLQWLTHYNYLPMTMTYPLQWLSHYNDLPITMTYPFNDWPITMTSLYIMLSCRTVEQWVIEMDRMSKFTYPRIRIRMRRPVQEDPQMRIHMRMPVSRYSRMRTRIFVTYLNNTTYCQTGAAFVTEYRLLHYTEY